MQIIETPPSPAAMNMTIDETLLERLDKTSEPILHFYEWEKEAATYGYFIDIEKVVDVTKAQQVGLDLAKRPTGGGVVFHIWDMAFSFLLPASHAKYYEKPLDNYYFVNHIVLESLLQLFPHNKNSSLIDQDIMSSNFSQFFCMAKPSKYDVLIGEKKIVGAAQRRKKNGYLHQGTISLVMPDKEYLYNVIHDNEVVENIFLYTHALLDKCSKEQLLDIKFSLKEKLRKEFQKNLD